MQKPENQGAKGAVPAPVTAKKKGRPFALQSAGKQVGL
jgi:hypothetical protein